jgi:Type III restriction enzyme, res subunit/Helicase conserved C-terminal domain
VTKKLTEVLARASSEELKAMLGPATVALVEKMAPGASNQQGFAELVVSQFGAAGSLRNPAVRATVLNQLTTDEATALCELLSLPCSDPSNTLKRVGFDRNVEDAGNLRSWFLVDYDTPDSAPEEGSRRAEPSDKPLRRHQIEAYQQLRQCISNRSAKVLVHMPFGAGKLRLVVTAVVDMLRSEPDGEVVLWLAHGNQLCEDAFLEFVQVWQSSGLREVTVHKLYGNHPFPDIAILQNAIVVADIERLSNEKGSDLEALRLLGERTRALVLNDATHIVNPAYSRLLANLACAKGFSIIGISGTSRDYFDAVGLSAALKRAFPFPAIQIEHQDPLNLLQSNGHTIPVEIKILASPLGAAAAATGDRLDIREDLDAALASNLDRNRWLIDQLNSVAQSVKKVVFFANTAEQARMFVGILALHGARAMVVTGDMSREQRSQEMSRFQSRREVAILCAHNVLVSGSIVHEVMTALVASPMLSPMLHSQLIGRLVNDRTAQSGSQFKFIIIDDGIPEYTTLVKYSNVWANMENAK